MNRFYRVAATLVALTLIRIVIAQDISTIEEVRVTASRTPVGADGGSEGVTSVDRAALDAAQAQMVTDALRGQTGVFVQQTTAGQGTAIVRGLKGSEVLHLVDGMRLNNALFRNAPNQYLALVDPFVTDRVEVVRGPLSTLYGSDAMGGVVQVITSMPFLGGADWRSQTRFLARYDGRTLGQSGHLSYAAGSGNIGFGAALSYQDHDDVRTAGRRALSPTAYRSGAASGFLAFQPRDGHEWRLSVQYLEQPSTPRYDELVPGFGQTEPASDVFRFEPNSRLFAHAEHRSTGWAPWLDRLEVHAAMQVVTDDRRTRNFGAANERREQNESRLFGLTVLGAVAPGARHALTYGIDVYSDKVSSARQSIDLASGTGTSVQSRFPDGSSILNVDAYVQDRLTLGRQLDLTLGGRISRSEVDLAGDGQRPAAAIDNTDVTGSIGLRYAPSRSLALVSNLGRGFRAPNIFDLGTLGERPGNRFNVANPALGPETVWTLDAGIEWRAERSEAELFLWISDYQDKITSVSTGQIDASGRDVVQSRNAEAVTLRGAEAAFGYAFSDRLRMDLGANYTWGETEADDATVEPADRIPPLAGHATLRYAGDGWWLESAARFSTRQDRLSARDVRDPRIHPDGTAGFGLIELRGGADLPGGFTVSGSLNNLADRAYREHGSGFDGPGRSLTLTLEGRF